jgi:formamidopyrimidine-DNA glycosylase
MPELPDLQVFSHNLNKTLSGKTVKEVKVPESKKLNVSVKELKSVLEDQKVKEIFREGKELYFKFSKGDILAMHLMLHGKLYLFNGSNEHKYTILELIFSDDTGLALTDFQGQATPSLNPVMKDAKDALSDEADADYLKERMSKTRTAIKNLLLDQHVIRGIGNAYADEILWDAKISPMSASNKIPPQKIKDLSRSIKKVLKDAEKQIIKTHPDIISGEVRDFLNIHNSRKKHSPTGAAIHFTTANSRKTYYTDEQELYK